MLATLESCGDLHAVIIFILFPGINKGADGTASGPRTKILNVNLNREAGLVESRARVGELRCFMSNDIGTLFVFIMVNSPRGREYVPSHPMLGIFTFKISSGFGDYNYTTYMFGACFAFAKEKKKQKS